MWLVSIIFPMFVLFTTSTVAFSDEIKDAAYCVGVLRKNIEVKTEVFGAMSDDALKSYQMRIADKTAIIEDAIKQNVLNIETSYSLAKLGEQEAKACWEQILKCEKEGADRSPHYKTESKRLDEICDRDTLKVCKRPMACD